MDKNETKIEDKELEEIISKRLTSLKQKIVVIGTGITSSHLGDERNIREFIIADSLVKKIREKDVNVLFYLFDDSYDPLNFRQLRVAVNKDEELIKKFEKYCGVPIRLIPDPYECHINYSSHFQNEILDRFHNLGIYPNIIDSYSSYESGLFNDAKEIVFKKRKEINVYLKKTFPKYTMKKLFYPICIKCLKMEGVDIKRIVKDRVTVLCSNCGHKFSDSVRNIRGKFSWKIDVAVKWNVFKVDFEPFSKAYLDPDVGSYFIAKKISEFFFDGYYPESINYGQIVMDKSLSYKALMSLPKDAFVSFFIKNRKKDMELSEKKFIQFAHDYKIDKNLSFYDYIMSLLPYDLFDRLQGKKSVNHKNVDYGIAFAAHFLGRELYPKLPTRELIMEVPNNILIKIKEIFLWVVSNKIEYPDHEINVFTQEFTNYLKENYVDKKLIFPTIRKLVSQEHTLPMSKIFFYAPLTYLSGCLLMILQTRANAGKKVQMTILK
ncbi:hypothetical protein HZA75_07135 [Candidatus Roizmanbacteria bacterium]|nr:hypothetical protein [Candidatus Roizmanbacteria bacterium]